MISNSASVKNVKGLCPTPAALSAGAQARKGTPLRACVCEHASHPTESRAFDTDVAQGITDWSSTDTALSPSCS
eukprot:6183851-Pleurochrysis_carterae.AAC.3